MARRRLGGSWGGRVGPVTVPQDPVCYFGLLLFDNVVWFIYQSMTAHLLDTFDFTAEHCMRTVHVFQGNAEDARHA
jgi:hypothetical protein